MTTLYAILVIRLAFKSLWRNWPKFRVRMWTLGFSISFSLRLTCFVLRNSLWWLAFLGLTGSHYIFIIFCIFPILVCTTIARHMLPKEGLIVFDHSRFYVISILFPVSNNKVTNKILYVRSSGHSNLVVKWTQELTNFPFYDRRLDLWSYLTPSLCIFHESFTRFFFFSFYNVSLSQH